jgi:hypothetical protein
VKTTEENDGFLLAAKILCIVIQRAEKNGGNLREAFLPFAVFVKVLLFDFVSSFNLLSPFQISDFRFQISDFKQNKRIYLIVSLWLFFSLLFSLYVYVYQYVNIYIINSKKLRNIGGKFYHIMMVMVMMMMMMMMTMNCQQ